MSAEKTLPSAEQIERWSIQIDRIERMLEDMHATKEATGEVDGLTAMLILKQCLHLRREMDRHRPVPPGVESPHAN